MAGGSRAIAAASAAIVERLSAEGAEVGVLGLPHPSVT